MEVNTFGWQDYGAFGAMLLVSMVIGVYHGFGKGSSGSSHDQFLTAGGRLAAFPVAVSMLASFLSSITLLGQPTEIYLYGPQYWLFGLASFLMIPVVGHVLIPVFRKNNCYSAYKYFGDRFNRWLELLASLFFSVHMIVFLALVLYAPALAMEQVTGVNTIMIVTLIYVVCIAYTTVGGIKGVVWTDTFQVIVLFVAMITILIKGTIDVGGVGVVWERNKMFNRTTFLNWDLDLTQRYTVWSSFIGAACLHTATYGASQLHIQRYLTVDSVESARKTLWINAICWTLIVIITTYSGLLIFAVYYDCDPLGAKKISKPDQLFPLYIMDTMKMYPGFPGVFMCGILSAGLSTVSTGVNSLAAIWFSELERTQFGRNLTPFQAANAVKMLAFGFGVLSYGFVHLVPFMGNLAPVAFSLSSVFTGSLFGLFILGICFRKANSWGAAAGLLTSLIILSWISIGTVLSARSGLIIDKALPTTISGCTSNITFFQKETPEKMAPLVYRFSYMWYCPIAIVITIVTGLIVSMTAEFISKSRAKTEELSPYYSTQQEVQNDNLLLNEVQKKPVIRNCKINY